MTSRSVLLKFHLYLGRCAALFLVILGVTGSVIAFEEQAELWLHHRLHYVRASDRQLSEGELIARVNRELAPAEVVFAQAFQLSGHAIQPRDPHRRRFGMPSRILFSVSSLMLAVLAVTGVVIWWKKPAVQGNGRLASPRACHAH